jgi:hypothetical protein
MDSVYLCGPINGKTDEECNGWRSKAKHWLGGSFVVVDPMARDFRGRENDNVAEIVEGDLADIAGCQFVLVNASAPSWGTAMKVFHAWREGKRVVAFTASDRISPWLRYHTHAIYETSERACMAILNFDVLVSRK